ncbi:MAG: magnesium transporter CorA family protein [Bacillota bacterium]|nr:MAG: hypothetical protein DIU70_05625 [Bacillota bacterium]
MLQAMLLKDGQVVPLPADFDAILSAWRQDPGCCLWLDVTAPDPATLARLSREFRIHPAEVAATLNQDHRAQLVEHREYFYLQLPVPAPPRRHEDPRRRLPTRPLDLIAGRRYLITLHQERLEVVDLTWSRFARGAEPQGVWPDLPVHSLCEAILQGYFPHLDRMEEELERAERQVFGQEVGREPADSSQALERIFAIRRYLLGLRRTLAPLRDTFASLARRDFPHLAPGSASLFAELYSRTIRLLEVQENLREYTAGLVEAYLTVQNNRMNQIMKTLTVISTIMLPLTVITGFFGMNFTHIPGLHSPWGFWGATAFMVALGLGMLYVFRRRGWI